MAKCLVTRLAGSVSNSSLLKLGEIKITSNFTTIGNSEDYIRVDGSSDAPITLKMESGYFRANKAEDINSGTEKTVDTPTELFPSIGEHVISVIPKYNLTYLQNVCLNINDLSLSKKLTSIVLKGTSSGDISVLKNLTELTYINFNNCLISGDISVLKNLTELTYINFNNCLISGDISVLKNLINLKSFDLSSINSKNIFGSISNLSNLSKLNNFRLNVEGISGDLATLPANCRFVALHNLAKFTWSSRPTNGKIVAIGGAPIISNIDKMLQDQAACQASINPGDLAYFKVITATGTRTSASDAAVQTLQSKGYTVSITPA